MALQKATPHEPKLANTTFIRSTDPKPRLHVLKKQFAFTFHLRPIIHAEKLDISKSLNLAEAWLYEYNMAIYGGLQNHGKRGKEELLRRIYHFIYTTDVLMRTENITHDPTLPPKACIIDDSTLGWLDELRFVTGVELPDTQTICDIFYKAEVRANHNDPNVI